ncbi:hypothetical protein B0T13DRAFT_474931 [Neurospora crassa]|nr:hypothetical protein B0T13DRAFT_474931 [Neurospora crassa]
MTGDDDGTIEVSNLPSRIITESEKNVHVDVNPHLTHLRSSTLDDVVHKSDWL